VPELPDLTVVAEALHAGLAGRRVSGSEAPGPLAVRGTPGELAELVDQRVDTIRRRGKFLLLELERDRICINPMLTGRFQLATPSTPMPSKTAFVLTFGERTGPPDGVPSWLDGAAWLPANGTAAEVRFRDPTQMGKVYLQPTGTDRSVPGLGEPDQGPDADDPALTVDLWRERIRRHPGELKNLLRNQAFVAGIGNAYSDEILWEARLLPSRRRADLASEEIDALYAATRKTLIDAIEVLRRRVAPALEKQVRDFLAVHDRGGQPCPRCGTRIAETRVGGFITSWCRTCQR
jgi:formamidopyrimidine-DNA glycosylase